MTVNALQFVELSDTERKHGDRLPKLSEGDLVEMRVRGNDGGHTTVPLPARAAALIETMLEHLYRGERVALLSEDQEVTPNEAAAILGISRPLVVHRMAIGDLPFRYVGKHRRAYLKDVLALKERIDDQNAALKALAEDTEALTNEYGV